MTDRDVITELADRLRERMRRGEELGIEFELDFASLTDEERGEFMALVEQQPAHGEEKLESLRENTRILLRSTTWWSRARPPGTTLWEAGEAREAGYIGVMDVIESIRAVPDPLQQKP
jgi:hypothetical protein